MRLSRRDLILVLALSAAPDLARAEGAAPEKPADHAPGKPARLRTRYGEAHDFELINLPEDGLLIRLTIPFRVADKPA